MENVLVSVVIPAFNAENYIQDCVHATINQTYRNIEVIIVDDGSEDSTLQICREMASKDARVRILSRTNNGVSTARNEGIDAAKGRYIVFFDADDYPEKTLIEEYIRAIDGWKDKTVSLIATGMYFDNYYNKHVGNKDVVLEVARGYVKGEDYLLSRNSAAMLSWLKLFNFVTNKCYDLDYIKEHHIRFDKNIHIGEDLKFNLDYIEDREGSIGFINSPLYHYVKRTNNSLSISYHNNDLEDTKYIYRRYINWESAQEGATEDNILVLKGIYIYDWVSRLTAIYQEHCRCREYDYLKKKLRCEIRSCEFQRMLKEIYKGKKISTLRYVCLRTGIFEVFYFFRGIYQILKG